jgi:hypothetical protein
VTREEAVIYVSKRFAEADDEFGLWGSAESEKTFQSLLTQLIDDHGVSPLAAVDILESAFYAVADEFLC